MIIFCGFAATRTGIGSAAAGGEKSERRLRRALDQLHGDSMVCIRRAIGALRRQWTVGAAFLATAPQVALASQWNFQTPVTPLAREQYDLHAYIFWICVAIFIGVFGVMFYSLLKHRKSMGHEA